MQAYNTRLFKREKDGKMCLDVLVASARTDIPPKVLEEGSAATPQVRRGVAVHLNMLNENRKAWVSLVSPLPHPRSFTFSLLLFPSFLSAIT